MRRRMIYHSAIKATERRIEVCASGVSLTERCLHRCARARICWQPTYSECTIYVYENVDDYYVEPTRRMPLLACLALERLGSLASTQRSENNSRTSS